MAAESFQKTIQRTRFFNIGDSEDPDATGPENYTFMMGVRKASVNYKHVANDTRVIKIFRAEQDCEIIAAHFRPDVGWTAAAASEDLYLVKDDGNQVGTENICFVNGTVDDVLSDKDNEWSNSTNGLPGVYAPGPFAQLPKGWWLYLQQTTNGAGVSMGDVTIEITYRYL